MEIKREYGIDSTKEIPANQKFDAIVLAVGHKQFLKLDYLTFLEDIHVIFDVKGLLSKDIVDMRL